MTRTLYPGGWYCDALPTGEYCILFPHSHIETHFGRVDFPAGEAYGVLYLRCTNVVEFSIGGQPHDRNDVNWQWWPDTGWAPHVTNYLGVSPVIFDLTGAFRQNDGSAGSQGYRYVAVDGTPTGRLVTSDETYYSAEMKLSQWTQIAPDLFIGQAHPDWAHDAAWLWDRGTLRQLESGPCTFIRANCVGEAVAIALSKPEGAVIFQTTVAELRALPEVAWPKPPEPPVTTEPPPEPGPEPEPEPEPEPIPPVPPIIGGPMETERGWLIGNGDKAMKLHGDGTVSFDTTELSEDTLLEATPIEGDSLWRMAVKSLTSGRYAGCDATKNTTSGNVFECYYGVTEPRGWAEYWCYGQWPSGVVEAVVVNTEGAGADNGRDWQVGGLTWVKQQ